MVPPTDGYRLLAYVFSSFQMKPKSLSNCCYLPLRATEEGKEERQEVTASLADASVNVAVE